MKNIKIDNYVLTYISVLVLFLVIYYLTSNKCSCSDSTNKNQKETFSGNVIKVFGGSDENGKQKFDQFLDGVIDIGKFNYMDIP